ncbi:MAG: hypothetical protein K6G10_01960 [Butyrivibrio sp.]|nr:hypothetical protein [Butyrivibrio sp.]
MKITESNVNLVSSRRYYEENSVSVQTGIITRGSFMDNLEDQKKKMDSLEISDSDMDDTALSSENYNSLKPSKNEYLGLYENTLENQIAELRNTLLDRILKFLQLLNGGSVSDGYRQTLSNTSQLLTAGQFVKVTTVEAMHHEEEETCFKGSGLALTEDGRSIDFNVEFSMSRRLTMYAGISMASSANLIDPLVINVGSDVTHISDQKFFFDLDCDGKEDELSSLGGGAGFLALDKNNDGRINNGSEFFGVQSGNGFKDLAGYDSDGNGWIDEADEIYDHLKIWIRNDDGTDTLMGLKEADVGAIYLGSAETQFSQYGPDFMLGAMTRSTGLFLRESGGVGTVQQVDFASV